MSKNYIVFDLEWNQSNKTQKTIENLPFEIIEIGAVKCNENREIIDSFHELIKPQVYTTMHFMTAQIIHLDAKVLDDKDTFDVVIERFFNWCGEDPIFCTWGNLDLLELQRNMAHHKVKPLSDGPIAFLDIQKLFSLDYEDGKSRSSLETAIDYFNIEKKYDFHRADNDAIYTALIFKEISENALSHFSLDIFHRPKDEASEVHAVFDTYSKYISREFSSRSLAMQDKEVQSTRCYICNRNAKRKIKWFTLNNKHYFCVAFCRNHGYLRAKARIKKTGDGNVYVVKTIRSIDEHDVEMITEKLK